MCIALYIESLVNISTFCLIGDVALIIFRGYEGIHLNKNKKICRTKIHLIMF